MDKKNEVCYAILVTLVFPVEELFPFFFGGGERCPSYVSSCSALEGEVKDIEDNHCTLDNLPWPYLSIAEQQEQSWWPVIFKQEKESSSKSSSSLLMTLSSRNTGEKKGNVGWWCVFSKEVRVGQDRALHFVRWPNLPQFRDNKQITQIQQPCYTRARMQFLV